MAALNLTEEQENILLRVFRATGLKGEFSREEQLEMAFDALLNSFDSQNDATEEQEEAGTPINAMELKAAMERVIAPDISLGVVPELKESIEAGDKVFSFEDLIAIQPDNDALMAAAEGDEACRQACEVVMNQLPQVTWKDERTIKFLTIAADRIRKGEIQVQKGVDKGKSA